LKSERAIEVRDLTRDFGAFRAVDHVNFEVLKGQIFGFLGPNGAGKSTTIRMLNGLLLPTSGGGSVAGLDIVKDHAHIKEIIGYMSQRFSLYDDLTVQENLTFFGGIYGLGGARLKERSRQVLNLVDLLDRRDQPTRTLAGGLRQRLALASSILHEPSILFLDEPTSGVDPNSRRNFWELIGDMAQRGVTVLVTTHYLDEAEYCDRLVLIYQGRLVAQGTPLELKQALPGRVLCLRPDDLGQALETVQELPQILEANIFGDSLHLSVAEDESETDLRSALEGRGVSCQRLERIEPSLEDAFISYIEAAKEGNQP
jgi:ABC-2 type transport system ATP-binding protein